jgi:hypothetical protein
MEKQTKKQIRFQVLDRFVGRMADIAESSDTSSDIKCVYDELIAPATMAFRESQDAVVTAKSASDRANLLSRQTLVEVDSLYLTIRAVVLLVDPAQVLPDTLKAQTTDTDALRAIGALVSVVKSHAGEAWADALMAGKFGTLAPKAEAALKASIAASDALEKARNRRRAAYFPAYAGYLTFKRIVRELLGASSRAYRRLTLRTMESNDEPIEPAEAEDEAPDSAVQPASKAAPAPAGGPSSVRVA